MRSPRETPCAERDRERRLAQRGARASRCARTPRLSRHAAMTAAYSAPSPLNSVTRVARLHAQTLHDVVRLRRRQHHLGVRRQGAGVVDARVRGRSNGRASVFRSPWNVTTTPTGNPVVVVCFQRLELNPPLTNTACRTTPVPLRTIVHACSSGRLLESRSHAHRHTRRRTGRLFGRREPGLGSERHHGRRHRLGAPEAAAGPPRSAHGHRQRRASGGAGAGRRPRRRHAARRDAERRDQHGRVQARRHHVQHPDQDRAHPLRRLSVASRDLLAREFRGRPLDLPRADHLRLHREAARISRSRCRCSSSPTAR